VSRADRLEDRLLAPLAMCAEGAHHAQGRLEPPAMARQIERVLPPLDQAVERSHVVGHVAFGRSDDARIPRHDVVAGKEHAAAGERETEMVGRMPGREHRHQLPAWP